MSIGSLQEIGTYLIVWLDIKVILNKLSREH